MTSNFQPSNEEDSQLLNSNMENISNELSSMLIAGDLDVIGAMGSIPMPDTSGMNMSISKEECGFAQCNNDYQKYAGNCGSRDVAGTIPLERKTLLSDNKTDLFYIYQRYYQQCLYIQRQEQMQEGQQNLMQQQLYNIMPTQLNAGISSSSIWAAHPLPVSHGLSKINNSYSSVPTLFKQIKNNTGLNDWGVSASTPNSPKFEFHFLRSQNNLYPDTDSEPLISSASLTDFESEHSSGTSRRSTSISRSSFSGHGHRKFSKYNGSSKEDDIDYDKITVDLSVLGLSIDNKEHNPVLRLFGLFRKMHYYLNDVLPSSAALNRKEITISNLEANAQARGTMPCTMNVQYQVKYAARKCTNFVCDMQRLLSVNKIYSIELYLECEKSLNILRNILTQFESFKRIDMEHKRGQFITEEVQVHTQKLEELLLQLNDQIRELQIYVHAFIWAVERSQQNLTFGASMNEREMVNANEFLVNAKSAEPLISSSHDNVIFGINTINSSLEQQSSTFTGIYERSLGEKETEIERQVTRYIG
ncbi:unnamed protein product [Ceratitis capitata]|uniref:(Mediterranean fruit fly) hypothetical protein n=1 Tax=Ceratitis capitata TaxID=7213 RepID=A0A811TY83_CERCA|nr:unnamed protein product [Ceratitis capitata]